MLSPKLGAEMASRSPSQADPQFSQYPTPKLMLVVFLKILGTIESEMDFSLKLWNNNNTATRHEHRLGEV